MTNKEKTVYLGILPEITITADKDSGEIYKSNIPYISITKPKDNGKLLYHLGMQRFWLESPILASDIAFTVMGLGPMGKALFTPINYGINKLVTPIANKLVTRVKAFTPYKNVFINGLLLTKALINALELSKQLLINNKINNPTIALIINNSDLGFTVPENFYSGVNATQSKINGFNGNIWLSNDPDVYTYFSNRNYKGSNNITNRFLAGYPKNAKIKEVDFKNNTFRSNLDSDEVVRDAVENGFDVIKQNNIIELTKPGTNIIIPKGTDRLIISKKPKFKYLDWNWLKFNYLK